MRFAFLLLILSVWLLGGCRDSEERVASDDTQTQEEPIPTGDFYKRLTGTIAGKPVVMHLHRIGEWVGGSYSYDAAGIPISLTSWNDATPVDEILELQEFCEAGPLDETYVYPRLHLKLTTSGVEGTWISADSGRRFAVALKESYEGGAVRLRAYSLFDSGRLFQSRLTPRATASYGAVAPYEEETLWIEEAIKASFGEPSSEPWPRFFRTLAEGYFAEYRDALELDSTDAASLESAMHNWSTESQASVVMNEKDWLVLRHFSSGYTGGAHGNHSSRFLVLDRKAKRAWTLTDVVQDTASIKPFLTTAAVDRWRLSPDAPLTDRLLVDAIPLTTNFYLTATGLGFVYSPYEIASYADGEVHLFVPYKRIGMLLTEEFKRRMNLQTGQAMRG